jgi:hypothetical protein
MMKRFSWSARIIVVASALVVASPVPTAADPIYGITPGNVLIRFDSATPGTVTTIGTVTGLGPSETIRGIDFRPRTGQLFVVTVTTASVINSIVRSYALNGATAQATLVGTTVAGLAGAGDVPTGSDFNPTVDRIRIANTNDENFRVNPNNGALAGNDTDLTPAATSTIIAAAYDRNFDRQSAAAIPTTLYVIDRNDSQLAILGGLNGNPSPNGGVITDLAPLGFNLNQTNDGGLDISPGRGGQRAFAALTDAADNLTRLYSISLPTALSPTPVATSIGLIGNGQTEVRSIAIAPLEFKITAADAGGWPVVRVFDTLTDDELVAFLPYEMSFRGGVRAAGADITGDGIPEIVTAPGPFGPPDIRIIDISGPFPVLIGSFLAYDPFFVGGVFVAAGDVNGDGWDDIILAPDAGASPHVRVISGRTGWDLFSFFAYDPGFAGGVRVAAGDVNVDGLADIITVPGPGGPPHVRVFSGAGLVELFGFFAYAPSFVGGVYVAAGDVSGDGRADIITSPGAGGGPHVKAFSGLNLAEVASFFAYSPSFTGGVRVAAGDWNNDGRMDIITAPGPGGGPHVRIFSGTTLAELIGFFTFTPTFAGGVFVW